MAAQLGAEAGAVSEAIGGRGHGQLAAAAQPLRGGQLRGGGAALQLRAASCGQLPGRGAGAGRRAGGRGLGGAQLARGRAGDLGQGPPGRGLGGGGGGLGGGGKDDPNDPYNDYNWLKKKLEEKKVRPL